MKFETKIGNRNLIIKIGEVAGQTNGSCVVQYGETVVLATAVMSEEIQEKDYLPLVVDYEEKFYAAGKIKGSRFIKREGRPTDEAILAGRFIDRAIRPLFNQNIRRAIQVTLTVLAIDNENEPDIVGLIAASCALAISDIPWDGPIAGGRVGEIDKKFIFNPTRDEIKKSCLNLVVCGKNNRVLMIEAGAQELNEANIFEAIKYGVGYFEKINNFLKEIQSKIGKEKIPLKKLLPEETPSLIKAKKIAEEIVKKASKKYLFSHILKTKKDRSESIKKIENDLDKALIKNNIEEEEKLKVIQYLHELIYKEVSEFILDKNLRIDGRKLDELRPISCQIGVLPRVHGSGLFSRGATQVLSVLTLGGPSEEQYLDTMEESGRKRYMHYYNFPPFCTGEARSKRSVGRREIGHGSLVEKGLLPIFPDKEKFPYTVRLVSEVLSSNGSSSMASLCASVLASMDGGIPIKGIVAGIAIGLASEEDRKNFKRYKLITDMQDLEDGPGGMDFKVIGTKKGITAIQMDTKTNGLNFEIIQKALKAAREARIKILEKMAKVIASPRPNLSPYAPRVENIHINPEKIKDVIGPGGKIINEIIDKTGVVINVEQDGNISITSADEESLKKAMSWIKDITREVKVGEVFQARITKLMDFGAFAEIIPGQEGLIHISEMAPYRVNHPRDIVKVGDVIPVKVIKIDKQGKIGLSIKALQKTNSRKNNYQNKKSYKGSSRFSKRRRY